jgi:hypothetical protein
MKLWTLDLGFWIGGFELLSPLLASSRFGRPVIQNPKSQIQNKIDG